MSNIGLRQRPFVNFYSPTFILYELSSPFLNIHWFLDKVNMTGSKLQWYNGMMLLVVFFCCRLVWGTWQSALVYRDMWHALSQSWSSSSSTSLTTPVNIATQVFHTRNDGSFCIDEACVRANAEISKFSSFVGDGVPTWLVLTYVISNLVLNGLNFYWFSKMIETVMKRFRTPEGPAADAKKSDDVSEKKQQQGQIPEDIAQQMVLDAAAKLEEEEGALFHGDEVMGETVASAVDPGLAEELRRRKAAIAATVASS